MKHLLVSLGGLETADAIMTHFFVRNGLVSEGNPLVAAIVRDGDFLVLKIIGAFLCALILWYLYQRFRKMTLIATSSIVTFYTVVIIWNAGIFFSGLNVI